jgi:hypothetical protein
METFFHVAIITVGARYWGIYSNQTCNLSGKNALLRILRAAVSVLPASCITINRIYRVSQYMELLTIKDEELMQSIHFFLKFPKRGTFFLRAIESLTSRNGGTRESALACGYYQFLSVFRIIHGIDLGDIDITPIVNAYNLAIELDRDYYLAKICKALLFLKLSQYARIKNEMTKVIGEIIEQQRKESDKRAHFIIPYIIYSDFYFSINEFDNAFEMLRNGKENSSLEPMPFKFLNDLFLFLFKDYVNRVSFAKVDEISSYLKELGRVFFPYEKMFI